jgi:hypothetical protein
MPAVRRNVEPRDDAGPCCIFATEGTQAYIEAHPLAPFAATLSDSELAAVGARHWVADSRAARLPGQPARRRRRERLVLVNHAHRRPIALSRGGPIFVRRPLSSRIGRAWRPDAANVLSCVTTGAT